MWKPGQRGRGRRGPARTRTVLGKNQEGPVTSPPPGKDPGVGAESRLLRLLSEVLGAPSPAER